jgi:hypothetical protein
LTLGQPTETGTGNPPLRDRHLPWTLSEMKSKDALAEERREEEL